MNVPNLGSTGLILMMNLAYNSGNHMTRLCQMDGRVDSKSERGSKNGFLMNAKFFE